MHLSQAVAFAAENAPASQSKQLPSEAHRDPAKHSHRPPARGMLLVGQGVHEKFPGASLNLPSSQASQGFGATAGMIYVLLLSK